MIAWVGREGAAAKADNQLCLLVIQSVFKLLIKKTMPTITTPPSIVSSCIITPSDLSSLPAWCSIKMVVLVVRVAVEETVWHYEDTSRHGECFHFLSKWNGGVRLVK